MQRVLIISSDEGLSALAGGLLANIYPDADTDTANCCSDGSDAALTGEYDLVIIDGELSGAAEGLALKITDKTTSGCIIISESGLADELADRVEDAGVLVLPKPIDKQLFRRILKLINASRSRMKGYAKENVRLQRRLDEIKAVNRAKMVLMQYLKFSENQAHRYIEKQAMDLRMTRYEIAMKVIKTYDLDA